MTHELDEASIKTWLHLMPEASMFKDSVYLACDRDGDWCAFTSEPNRGDRIWDDYGDCAFLPDNIFNMPELVGDQWKYSCISIHELDRYQKGLKK